MSYSIMTPFNTEEDRNMMFDFLINNYKDINSILNLNKNFTGVDKPLKNEDISYRPEKNIPVIGFNYHHIDFDQEYACLLCYWMAQIYGKEEFIKQLNRNCKYVLYDGDEPIYLIGNDEDIDYFGYVKIDNLGFRKLTLNNKEKGLKGIVGRILKYMDKKNGIDWDDIDNKFLKELERLTDLWNNNKSEI